MRIAKKKELLNKGWTFDELKRAERIVEERQAHSVFFSKIVFWSALLVIIFGNILVSLVLIPFLIALEGFVLYGMVVLLAIIIGYLYNFLITDIAHLEQKHHIMASILVPIIAIANLLVMVGVSNKLADSIHIGVQHNPWVVAIVFAVTFIMPSIVHRVWMSHKDTRKAMVVR